MARKNCLRPGCSKPAKPKGDYCSDLCRAHAHKIRKRLGGMLPLERRREVDRESKRMRRAGGVIASDVRLAYEKTVHEVALGLCRDFGVVSFVEALDRAERLLAPALPERLRPEMVPVSREEQVLAREAAA